MIFCFAVDQELIEFGTTHVKLFDAQKKEYKVYYIICSMDWVLVSHNSLRVVLTYFD